MGFKVLLRSATGEFRSRLDSVFSEQPFKLLMGDDIDWGQRAEAQKGFKACSPSIVINFLSGDAGADGDAIKNIGALCQEKQIPLVHFSNYHVFGRSDTASEIAESVAPSPKDALGRGLLELENIVAENKKHIILRTSWLIGGEHENLLDVLIPKLTAGASVFVSDHDYGRPVTINFLADIVLALTQQLLCGAQNWGAFHVHGSDKCSEAEFCDALVRLLKVELGCEMEMPLVAGVDDDRRLLSGNAMISGARCTDNFGIQLKSWRNGLKTNVRKYLQDNHLIAP